MRLGRWAQQVLPPPLYESLQRLSGRSMRFSGPYRDWREALRQAGGYDDEAILRRVRAATREVIAGHAAYERDSVAFIQPAMPMTVLAVLLRHVLRNPGPLRVIDLGGSLGSLYRHCRPYLPPLQGLRWHVVEQAAFVAAGRAEFTTDELDFHGSIDALPADSTPSFLLVSGVLQYLERPMEQFEAWARSSAATLFIDRLTLSTLDVDTFCVQHAPKFIVQSSYACRVLSRRRLLEALAPHWRLAGEHDCPRDGRWTVKGGPEFGFQGLLFDRTR